MDRGDILKEHSSFTESFEPLPFLLGQPPPIPHFTSPSVGRMDFAKCREELNYVFVFPHCPFVGRIRWNGWDPIIHRVLRLLESRILAMVTRSRFGSPLTFSWVCLIERDASKLGNKRKGRRGRERSPFFSCLGMCRNVQRRERG